MEKKNVIIGMKLCDLPTENCADCGAIKKGSRCPMCDPYPRPGIIQ